MTETKWTPELYEALNLVRGIVLTRGNNAEIEAVEIALAKARGE